MSHKLFSYFISFFTICSLSLNGQTIAEKKAALESNPVNDCEIAQDLHEVNQTLQEMNEQLKTLYLQGATLYAQNATSEQYKQLLAQIAQTKTQIAHVQKLWQAEVAQSGQRESYGLMHAPDTLLCDFVVEYSNSQYLYLMPPEIAMMRINIHSNLAVPRESWEECLEMILAQYGIGINPLNPYLRQLYLTQQDPRGLKAITDSLDELACLPPKSHVGFIITDEAVDPRQALSFFRKFANPQTTQLEIFGGKLFILSTVDVIQELFKLYQFVDRKTSEHDLQLVTLNKIDAKEMATIIEMAFNNHDHNARELTLTVTPLTTTSQAILIAGPKSEIKRAIKLVEEIEANIEDPEEKTLFWYTAKHSDAEELATVLAKVYDLLVNSPSTFSNENVDAKIAKVKEQESKNKANLVVTPSKVEPASAEKKSHKTADGQNNFIVDPKTGSIMMVVKQDALPKIKQLLKRLDVPKKMVQLEVLLFEKKMGNEQKCGLNLLKLGSEAAKTISSGLSFQTGILSFFVSHKKESGIPAYDLAYNFLLAQDDVQINASPSVTTMNQTPATIAIVEEISIDAGADDKKNKIYNRAQYGITIKITPTINIDLDEENGQESERFITLETDITFDSTKKAADAKDRPDVTRRHIENHVRIADGQTVILGGLRRKNQDDKKNSIPFLGEIPGIGKLFSMTEMSENSTEMFIFITAKIISDPIEDAERIKMAQLQKRAGDLPEFLAELDIAKDKQKRKLFEGSINALFGRQAHEPPSRKSKGEYDGR